MRPENLREIHKRCEVCGEIFTAKSGHAKFCPNCRENGLKIAYKLCYQRQEIKRKESLAKEYAVGRIYICNCCGRKIRYHGRTTRKICDECLSHMGTIGLIRLNARKDLQEEVVEDV